MSPFDKNLCPLCKTPFPQTGPGMSCLDGSDDYVVVCPRCGRYRITFEAIVNLRHGDRKPRLCALARQSSERGKRWRITADVVERESGRQPETVAEKQRLLLEYLALKSKFPGNAVAVTESYDWPVADCDSAAELHWQLMALKKRDLIQLSATPESLEVTVESEGWLAIQRRSAESVEPDRAFVAMCFDVRLEPAWNDGFRLAIERAGYRAHRADTTQSTEAIDLKLIGDIRRSRFVVADVSLHRPNVYFEAGYALALEKPVIWTVREDQAKDLHFDTRQFPHLIWRYESDLASQLEAFISGTVGRLVKSGAGDQ